MPWQPQWLPPGFTLALAPQRIHRGCSDLLRWAGGVVDFHRARRGWVLTWGPGRAAQGATVAFTKPDAF